MTFRQYALAAFDKHYINLQLRVLYRFMFFFFLPKQVKRDMIAIKLEKAEKDYGTSFIVKTVPEALVELQHEHEDMYGYELGIMQLEGK